MLFGFVLGMLFAALIFELCEWADRHLIFIR
jgi:uncharacterized membrane protein